MIKNSHGFSLTEMMVVAAIIAIMALITAPSLVTGLPTYRIKAAVRDCTSQLRNARQLAIKDKRNVTVTFDADNQFFEVDGLRFPHSGSFNRQYGSGVALGTGSATSGVDGGGMPDDGISLNEDSFIFTSRGLADFGPGTAAGAVYFTNNRDDSYAVAINAAGAVALLRWRGSEWKTR
jgi:prepilin-type N-terminal cleavage/methylation domain-containing protein